MGGAIGEWSNSAPRAEPCHWATWVAPIFSEANSLHSQEISTLNPTTKPPSPPPAPPLPPPWPKDPLPADSRTQAAPGGPLAPPLATPPSPSPLGPPGPPCGPPLGPPPLAPLAPPGLPWPSLAPPAPGPPALAALLQKRQVPARPCGQGRGGN